MSGSHGSSRFCGFASIVIAAALLAACPALAQVNPPSWWDSTDENTISLSFTFDDDTWAPLESHEVVPAWYAGTAWDKGGDEPEWIPLINDHAGAWGLGSSSEGFMEITLDNQLRPDYVKKVWYQFDVYLVGATTCIEPKMSSGSSVCGEEEPIIEDLAFGWKRVTGLVTLCPQPEWETLTWTFETSSDGMAAIDNVHISTHCEVVPEPSAIAVLACSMLGVAGFFRRQR